MGLFKSIKKAFKKVAKAVKKNVKRVVDFTKKQVKNVGKVVKKIGKSKLLKALVIAAAIVVTGGAALTAFGGTGALATSQFGTWMMSTSQAVLGGTAFGTGATSTLGKVAQGTGNFLAKTAAKPLGAVGGALGSTARVGANLLTGQSAFASGSAIGAPAPFSSAAFSGQLDYSKVVPDSVTGGYINSNTGLALTPEEIAQLPESFTSVINNTTTTAELNAYQQANPSSLTGNKWGDVAVNTALNVGSSVAAGYAGAKLQEGDPRGVDAPLMNESKDSLGALQIYAAQNNFEISDIYSQMTYGTADPGYMASTDLYKQDTVGVPA
jgi:hypothetical protein|tara:strand:- start:4516 stop:5487 length:972 start_codon:yes stop_codon:yes gene_type:complete